MVPAMPIREQDLHARLESAFPDATIAIRDLAGDNDHWEVTIVSPVFAGKTRIAQHRLVQDAVAGEDIHALSIKTHIGEKE